MQEKIKTINTPKGIGQGEEIHQVGAKKPELPLRLQVRVKKPKLLKKGKVQSTRPKPLQDTKPEPKSPNSPKKTRLSQKPNLLSKGVSST